MYSLEYYIALTRNLGCVKCGDPLPDRLEHYNYGHDGGWFVEGFEENQWLYFVCPDPMCRYQISLEKLGIEKPIPKRQIGWIPTEEDERSFDIQLVQTPLGPMSMFSAYHLICKELGERLEPLPNKFLFLIEVLNLMKGKWEFLAARAVVYNASDSPLEYQGGVALELLNRSEKIVATHRSDCA